MTRLKFSERRMEGRTGVMCMYSNELRVGVKSLSNSAMAGSCRNMPQYSLLQLWWRGKVRIWSAGSKDHGTLSNSKPVIGVTREWGPVRKVPFRDPNKGDWS